jgi:exopolysaccharide/PEP-CTERM locus tyrosine autokinase
MTQPGRRDEESLIERAAKVYDFAAHLRGRGAPAREVEDAAPASPPPFVPSEVEAPAQTDSPVARPSTSLGTNGESEAEGGWQVPPTLAAIPPEFLSDHDDDGMDEWIAPDTDEVRIDRAMLAEKGMLVPGAPVGALAEEFRLIKRQLLLTAQEVAKGPMGQRARTILVGSGKPGEGKTFCTINLAISLAAERDVEILLVDADFAKPDVMASLGLDDDAVGFLDILADPTIDPETCVIRTDVPQLSLLPVGERTHADTELLASRRTEEVLDRLLAANPKRLIVFDTPPALAASPASVLALLVGQVMLVVRADRTTESDVREAVALLDGCERIQLILNAVSYSPGRGRFGSYYGQER